MTDFPYDKSLNKEDHSFSSMKEKLEIIMQTLQNDKYQFVKAYQRQIQAYQLKIAQKDNIIQSLRQKLDESNRQLTKEQKKSSKLQNIINELKGQIFKMASVVSNFDRTTNHKELKRVKSDHLQNTITKVNLEKDNLTSLNTRKFDINHYFQSIKNGKSLKKQDIRSQKWQYSDDNTSNAETIKIKSQLLEPQVLKALKSNSQNFKKTLKWREQRNFKPQSNRLKIKDYKQNFWEEIC